MSSKVTGFVSTYVLPCDAFALVFVLLLFENQFDEQLLQFLIAVIDAQLFETTQCDDRVNIVGDNELYLLLLKISKP